MIDGDANDTNDKEKEEDDEEKGMSDIKIIRRVIHDALLEIYNGIYGEYLESYKDDNKELTTAATISDIKKHIIGIILIILY